MMPQLTCTCHYCHSASDFYFKTRDYNQKISEETFNHYQCRECGLIFIDPIPLKLGDYYPETYHFIPDSPAYLDEGSKHERYKIDLIKDFVSEGRLLEIGPSYGSFTYLAKEAGFEVEAIEMSKKCCKFLEDVVGVRAINSSAPESALQELGPYDVIALWHVIEHLPNAWATLEAMCSRVRTGGYVVLAAPNPDAFQFHLMGRYWPHVDAPRHVMLIPMKFLEDKMSELGMKAELITTRDEGSLGWNTFGWEFFFANLSSHKHVKRVLHRVGRLVAWFLAPIERREGKGSAYTMVFKKVA